MVSKKLYFIYNPLAGKGQLKNHLMEILGIFSRAGYDITVYPTKCQGDAILKIRELSGEYSLIVCSGGDGTLDEVVTGMMQSGLKIPLGYIPAGSTNDFAESMGLLKNMKKAAKTIITGKNYACDVGSFNDDIFVYIAAFGLFTDVAYNTRQEMKNVLGHMAYLLEGMKRLSTVSSYQLKITCDEYEIEDKFIFGMVTNSISVGGFKRITGKNVELNDGLFEVTLIKRPKNPIELNNLISAMVIADIDSNLMYCFKTRKIEFSSMVKIPWTLDGEFGGEHTQVEVENIQKAIEIKRP